MGLELGQFKSLLSGLFSGHELIESARNTDLEQLMAMTAARERTSLTLNLGSEGSVWSALIACLGGGGPAPQFPWLLTSLCPGIPAFCACAAAREAMSLPQTVNSNGCSSLS